MANLPPGTDAGKSTLTRVQGAMLDYGRGKAAARQNKRDPKKPVWMNLQNVVPVAWVLATHFTWKE